ncbi:putative licheninase transcription factor interactor and regulator CCHC(Zn) family [Rosa chinensis]|uniref:glucan endo-1,3-beta-D-glucosidase n=1 Tax=Rosa chinensis TaxID=74649 RepID=A0A2P6RKN0_ROSCH|nr:putative licheninase transcription factor interactor and regulator CCHC(Zn) family [Rosa chinensis]
MAVLDWIALILCVLASFDNHVGRVGAVDIGVCHGRQGNDLPAATDVINLYKKHGIAKIRLFEPNHAELDALKGSGIGVTDWMSNFKGDGGYNGNGGRNFNSKLSSQFNINQSYTNSSDGFSNRGFNKNKSRNCNNNGDNDGFTSCNDGYIQQGDVYPHFPNNNFDGNKGKPRPRITNTSGQTYSSIVCQICEKQGHGAYNCYYRNSQQQQEASSSLVASSVLSGILEFLASTDSPLMINVYPYFAYKSNPGSVRLDYAQFTATDTVVQDGAYSHYYRN